MFEEFCFQCATHEEAREKYDWLIEKGFRSNEIKMMEFPGKLWFVFAI